MISWFVQEYQYKGSIMIQLTIEVRDTLFMQLGMEKEINTWILMNREKSDVVIMLHKVKARIHKTQFSKY